eukprot:Pgem_evm1s7818
MPWQAVFRYRALFSNLKNYLPEDHPDHFSTTQAIASIDAAADYLKLITIQKKIVNNETLDLVKGGPRRFLLE